MTLPYSYRMKQFNQQRLNNTILSAIIVHSRNYFLYNTVRSRFTMYEYRNGLIIGLLVMMNAEAGEHRIDIGSGHQNYGSISTQQLSDVEPKPSYLKPLQKQPRKKQKPLELEAEPETASCNFSYNLDSDPLVRSNSDSCLATKNLKSPEMLNEYNEARTELNNARASLAVFSPLQDKLKACVEDHNAAIVCRDCIIENVQQAMVGAFVASQARTAFLLATEGSDDLWVACTLASTLGSGAIVGLKGAVQYARYNYQGSKLARGLGIATVEVRKSLAAIWASAAKAAESVKR